MSRHHPLSATLPRLSVLLLLLSSPAHAQPSEAIQLENLRAFARLYGHVRFFHPADEAAQLDWNRVAVYAVDRVVAARDRAELQDVLEDLFGGIAPGLLIYPADQMPPPTGGGLIPQDTAGLRPVAWQHYGVWLGPPSGIYRSIRTNRPPPTGQGDSFGLLVRSLGAGEHRGKRVKLRAAVRTEVGGSGNQGQVWLRVDRAAREVGFFDNMADRPITSDEWAVYELEGPVAKDAARFSFGAFLNGRGRMWVDDFELLVGSDEEGWESLPLENAGFEQSVEGEPLGWNTGSAGYSYNLDEERPHSGILSLRIARDASVADELFPETRRPGETVERELGAGLKARIPLVLYSDDQGTLPRGHPEKAGGIDAADEASGDSLTADDLRVRLADVVIAWNVFQHFYPYFDVVDVDWGHQLTLGLERALADEGAREFYDTLRLLIAALEDGHGFVAHPEYSVGYAPALLLDWVEGRVVITASEDTSLFRVGDVVLSIDGMDAVEALKDEARYYSGSPQWRRWRALRSLPWGEEGSVARFVLERDGGELEVEAERTIRGRMEAPERPHVEEPRPGIFYVNLDNTPMTDIDARMDELSSARGVIFDLRGYPDSNHEVLTHLLPGPDTMDSWMRVPHFIYPDRERLAGYTELGWGLLPREPRIEGSVVFITNGRAISYAESVMGFVEGYDLGEIVGSPTAGANGNVNRFRLPGGFQMTFTGMRVVRHDGTPLHAVGIQPTIPSEPTLAGLRQGRDDVLLRALEFIEEGR